MPRYRWSCLSCGQVNEAQVDSCRSCACPASATVSQITAGRARFIEQGGALQGEAMASAEPDLSAFDVLGRPLLYLLLGWRPLGPKGRRWPWR
jgi:hypothetical protein